MLKYTMIDLIREISIEQLIDLDYLRYDLQADKNYGMTPAEYRKHRQLAFELLLLDFDCYLQIYYRSKSYLTNSWSDDEKNQLAKKLLTKNLQMVCLNIRAKHNLKLIYSLLNNIPTTPNEYMDLRYNDLSGFEHEKRELILQKAFQQYCIFANKWVHSPLFWKIYIRPHGQKIKLTEDADERLWQQLLKDLGFFFLNLQPWMNSVQVIAAFQFWVNPLRYLPDQLQSSMSELVSITVNNSAKYLPAIETEEERIRKMSDFIGSTYASIFLWENRDKLSFPVLNNCLDNINSFENELYIRFGDAMVKNQSHPKYKLLLSASRGNELLSYSDKLTAFKYLLYYSGNLFKGHITELFALTLVKQSIPTLFSRDDLVLIPGSAVKYGNKQGADGLIALISVENDGYAIHILGIVEVKSYYKSERQLLVQLKKHEQRLKSESIIMLINKLNGNAYFAHENGLNPNEKPLILNIERISFDIEMKYITVLPAISNKHNSILDKLIKIYMPWSQTGILQMSYQFIEWIITNLARTIDTGNYELGQENWVKLLGDLLSSEKLLSKNMRKQITIVKTGLEEGWANADEYL